MVSYVTLEGSFMRKSVHAFAAAISLLSTGAMAAESSLSACGFAPYISQTNVTYTTNYNTEVGSAGNTLNKVTAKINYDAPSFSTLKIRICHQQKCTTPWQDYTTPNFSSMEFLNRDANVTVRMEARVEYNGTRLVNRSGKSSCATVYYTTP